MKLFKNILIVVSIVLLGSLVIAEGTVKVGLNYPKTGPYSVQGLDQFRAASMAIE